MSIELENPDTALAKVDAVANFVAQMRIALMVGDTNKLNELLNKSEKMLFDATRQLEEAND